MDLLRDSLTKAEEATRTARKRYNEEIEKLNESQSQFNAADGIRQEAYAHLQSLKKKHYEKVHFYLRLFLPFLFIYLIFSFSDSY